MQLMAITRVGQFLFFGENHWFWLREQFFLNDLIFRFFFHLKKLDWVSVFLNIKIYSIFIQMVFRNVKTIDF
jgi:hypothetical protein